MSSSYCLRAKTVLNLLVFTRIRRSRSFYASTAYNDPREACTLGPITEEQAQRLVLIFPEFIASCAGDQIRLAPDKFIIVCKRFKDEVLRLESPLRGVAPLLESVKKLQSSSKHLTTLHPDFLQLCLLSKCYKTGMSILVDDIVEIDQPGDLFLYCYYGGMVCIGQKCHEKALELLHDVVTAPMSSISAIVVEAYKKFILVSLIHNGQFSTDLPDYTSLAAKKNLKTLCKPYIGLANCYSSGNILEFETYIHTNKEKFESDKNLGLVKQALSSMYKTNIKRLTKTHLVVPLQDIANAVQLTSPKEAEMQVLKMIQDGEIFATINQADGTVRFLEDPEQYKVESIESSIQRMMILPKELTTADELISCDRLYLEKKDWLEDGGDGEFFGIGAPRRQSKKGQNPLKHPKVESSQGGNQNVQQQMPQQQQVPQQQQQQEVLPLRQQVPLHQRPEDLPPLIPAAVDWREQGILLSPIHDQTIKKLNICWAIATAAATEAAYNLTVEEQRRVALSPQDLINRMLPAKVTAEGSVMTSLKKIFDSIQEHKLCEETSCHFIGKPTPNSRYRRPITIGIDGYEVMENIVETDLLALVHKQPVVGIMEVDEAFLDWETNEIYPGPIGLKFWMEHAVLIVGYGTNDDGRHFWWIRNSYGGGWGDGGYARLIRRSSSPNQTSLFKRIAYPKIH